MNYDPDAVGRFWQILIRADTLLKRFSTNFYGKISPVHFFWGFVRLGRNRFQRATRADASRIGSRGVRATIVKRFAEEAADVAFSYIGSKEKAEQLAGSGRFL